MVNTLLIEVHIKLPGLTKVSVIVIHLVLVFIENHGVKHTYIHTVQAYVPQEGRTTRGDHTTLVVTQHDIQ